MTDTYHPLRGAPGLTADRARPYHEQWLLGAQDGRLLRAQDVPELAELQLEMRLGALMLRAPGMMRLDIPLDVIEDDESAFSEWLDEEGRRLRLVDEGELAGTWFSRWLGRPVRLLKKAEFNPEPGLQDSRA